MTAPDTAPLMAKGLAELHAIAVGQMDRSPQQPARGRRRAATSTRPTAHRQVLAVACCLASTIASPIRSALRSRRAPSARRAA